MFEEFIRNGRTEIYNFMCSIDANKKENQSYFDNGSSGDGNELPSNLTTE